MNLSALTLDDRKAAMQAVHDRNAELMAIMTAMFYYIGKLASSGTLKVSNALNSIGEVYLTVGANRSKIGKVQVKVQGALRELDALTDHDTDLTQGNVIKVIEVTSNGILIIEPQN